MQMPQCGICHTLLKENDMAEVAKLPKASRKGDIIHLTLKGGKFMSFDVDDAAELRDVLAEALSAKIEEPVADETEDETNPRDEFDSDQ